MHSRTEDLVRNSAGAQEGWGKRRAGLLLGMMFVGAVALRLYALGRKSFWLDEIASVVISLHPGAVFWSWVWHHEGNMALYYVLLKPWLHLGLNEATVRLLSVVPGVLAVPATYLLGQRLFSRVAGLIAALLMTLSACGVVYSQEARGYSLLVLAVIVATYLFVGLVERPSAAGAAAYGLAAAVTLYCHYFGLLAIAAHFASLPALSRSRRSGKHLWLSAALIAVLGAPVLWMIHIQDTAHIAWVGKPSWLELYHLGVFLAAEGGKAVGAVLLVVELPLIVLFLCRTASRRHGDAGQFWRYCLMASGLLTPIALSLMISIVKPVFFHRFLIVCLPAWLTMIAAAIAALGAKLRAIVLTAICALSLICIAQSYSRIREDWKGVAEFLIGHAGAGDRVLYYQPVGFFAAESYRDWLPGGMANRPKGSMVQANENVSLESIGAPHIWLVRYPANVQDQTLHALQSRLETNYRIASSTPFRAVNVTEYIRNSQP